MTHPSPIPFPPASAPTLTAVARPIAVPRPAVRRRALLGALLAAPALHGRAARAEAAGRVSILHLNDFHSRHEGLMAGGAGCRPDRDCFGGSARLVTATRRARAAAAAEGRGVALLDAGDQFTGSLFSTLHLGAAEAMLQRALGVDAMALGNHEFDKGPGVLADYLEGLPFPVLGANLDLDDQPRLRRRVAPWTALAVGGRRLVVVGLTTPDTATSSSAGPGVRFGDPAAALHRAVHAALAEGPATVVVLSHLGFDNDRRLARSQPGIDLIVGGHSHTLLADGVPGAAGPHPVLADGPAGPVRIVQAGAFGRWLGRLDLDLDADGRVLRHGGAVLPVDATLPEDPAVAAAVAGFAEPLAALRRRPVATVASALGNAGCNSGDCALGRLVCEALLLAAPGSEAALFNGGGLRAGLPAGVVTMGDVLTVLPFNNTVATVTLRGGALRAALENGLSRAPEASGRFPQVAGMRFTWNPAAPPGRRLLEVEVAGAPLDPDRAYRLATNNFLRRGGDDYAPLRDDALEFYDEGLPVEDALIARLADGRPLPD